MGAYLGYILAFATPTVHEPEVRVDSQNDIACCTTVIYDSDDEMPLHLKKKTHK